MDQTLIITSPPPASVLGVYGSPRKGGNTGILLEEFLRGASQSGSTIERMYLSQIPIKGCQSCKGCAVSGQCVIEDGMQEVYKALDNSDRIVIASPIYFYNVTSQTKAMIDRSQAFWSRRYLIHESRSTSPGGRARKGFFISVAATKGKRLFEGAEMTMRYFFDAIDVEYSGSLLFSGVDERGAIKDHPSALKEAFEAGVRFVSG